LRIYNAIFTRGTRRPRYNGVAVYWIINSCKIGHYCEVWERMLFNQQVLR